MGTDFYLRTIFGVDASGFVTSKQVTRERTKYNRDTGVPEIVRSTEYDYCFLDKIFSTEGKLREFIEDSNLDIHTTDGYLSSDPIIGLQTNERYDGSLVIDVNEIKAPQEIIDKVTMGLLKLGISEKPKMFVMLHISY